MIPTPSEIADGDVAAMLGREVAEVRGLLRTAEVFPTERNQLQAAARRRPHH